MYSGGGEKETKRRKGRRGRGEREREREQRAIEERNEYSTFFEKNELCFL
jgi:hypothetical protein